NRRVPSGRSSPGQHAALELARAGRRQRARARSRRLYRGNARGGRRGCHRAAESRSALHPHLSARPTLRGVGCDPRPTGRFPEGPGDRMSQLAMTNVGEDEPTPSPAKPRLGFLGVGWIGRQRMEVIAERGFGEVCAIADASAEMRSAAARVAPEADLLGSVDEPLEASPDGIGLATPSALHAGQSLAALERGLAVFCQKPLGRTTAEAAAVVEAARAADRLLGVDFSYRFTDAFSVARDVVRSGEIGDVFAAELVFHNAYGPDKPWFYDYGLAGGGCVMDLGIHLIDLAFWFLGFPG